MNIIPKLSRRKFIKQFHGPPAGSTIRCFRFWELVAAAGCPYRCAYCFLQATPSFVFGNYPLSGAIFENWQEMLHELEGWLQSSKGRVLVLGELQEGLAFERAYRQHAGQSLTEMLIPRFAEQEDNQLLFLSKSVDIGYAKKLLPTDRVIFSWSVNSERAATRWEKGAPRPYRRFRAAEEMKELGWTIRFRLDPMIPYDGWQEDYGETIKHINSLKPEMVTLGSLRASNTLVAHTKRNGRNSSVFHFLSEKDLSNFKWRIPYEQQLQLYKFAIDRLDPSIRVALCKEDRRLWDDLGMTFHGCNCLMIDKREVSRKGASRRRHIKSQMQIPYDIAPLAAKGRR